MKSRRQDTRSGDKIKDSNEKLRAENRRLRKKISQLQKHTSKFSEFDTKEWEILESDISSIQEENKNNLKCPECKTNLKIISAGIFEIKICENCGWRRRKKVDSGL